MGEVAGIYSDFVIVTSDNPGEEQTQIFREILPGLQKQKSKREYLVLFDRKRLLNVH